jgi:hypothetical protein
MSAAPRVPGGREHPDIRPLYARVLRLRQVNPGGLLCFAFFEGSVALGILMALAELAPWWAVVALPLTVACLVKFNDVVAAALARPAGAVRGPAPPRRIPDRRHLTDAPDGHHATIPDRNRTRAVAGRRADVRDGRRTGLPAGADVQPAVRWPPQGVRRVPRSPAAEAAADGRLGGQRLAGDTSADPTHQRSRQSASRRYG